MALDGLMSILLGFIGERVVVDLFCFLESKGGVSVCYFTNDKTMLRQSSPVDATLLVLIGFRVGMRIGFELIRT